MKSPAKNVNRPDCAGQQTTLSRFNGRGQRFLRETPSTQTVFSYGMEGHNLLSETTRNLSTSALSTTEHIWLPTASGPMPVAAVINGVHHAVHADHLNTPRKLSDSAGQTRWQWPYGGFGEINPQSTPTAGQAAISYALRYPGQIDDGNGLFYNWHRFYDPRVGRYTSSDPIGLEGGWNRFGYVDGNPLMYTDPEGLQGVAPTPFGPVPIPILPSPTSPGRGGYDPRTDTYTPPHQGWSIPDWFKNWTEMSRGKEQGRNWATEDAKRRAQENKSNPCDELDKMLEEAKCQGDTRKIRDIETAQKFLPCRNINKRKNLY